MMHTKIRCSSMAKRRQLTWLIPLVLCASGCGDGGGEGGFSGIGTSGGGSKAGAVVYVTNKDSDNVSGFTVNPSTGGLTVVPGAPFSNVPDPSAIAVSSNGLLAFVANSLTNKVTAFQVGSDGGFLLASSTPTAPNPAAVGSTPRAIVLSTDSKFLYVANSGSNNVSAFTIGTGGVLTPVPGTTGHSNPVDAGGLAPVALAISPIGRSLYVANSTSNSVTAFQIETSGLLTQVPSTGPGTNPVSASVTAPTALAISSNGQFLYVTNGSSNTVTTFKVEPSGLLTLVPPTGSIPNPLPTGGTTPNGVAIAPKVQFLYIANGGGNVSAFAMGNDGLLTLVSASGAVPNPTPTGSKPVALTISQDGQFLYVANQEGTVSAFTITSVSGTLVPLTPLIGNPFRAGTSPSAIAVFSTTSQ